MTDEELVDRFKLSPRQLKYVRLREGGMNDADAQRGAGWTGQRSSVTRSPRVIAALAAVAIKQQKELARGAALIDLNPEYVLGKIVTILEQTSRGTPVLHKGKQVYEEVEGEMVPVKRYEYQHALKAAELLGKHLRMWEAPQELGLSETVDLVERLQYARQKLVEYRNEHGADPAEVEEAEIVGDEV